eukprot:CAMPEP_0172897766 /NCGR_PEP_ID=MMETSP1075-20121228/158291_1 /TAXON_ID=2916 /ORGANISM="Ceratium fusus, Strain PA161109" /LENGTH=43 /DNA_ID= /DNA_START= /DNA_END= /DNA_ORIENTATION=
MPADSAPPLMTSRNWTWELCGDSLWSAYIERVPEPSLSVLNHI